MERFHILPITKKWPGNYFQGDGKPGYWLKFCGGLEMDIPNLQNTVSSLLGPADTLAFLSAAQTSKLFESSVFGIILSKGDLIFGSVWA